MQLSAGQRNAMKIGFTALTVLILYLMLRNRHDLSREAILSAVRQVRLSNALLVVLLAMVQIFFMVLRLYVLCPVRPRSSLKDVTFAMAVGHAMNMFLPARAGEAMKILWLGRSIGNDKGFIARGAGWLIADRAVDLLGFFLLVLFSGVLALPAFRELIPFSLWWFPVALAALVALGFAINAFSSKFHAKIHVLAVRLKEGASGVLKPKSLILGLLAGLACWTVEIAALEILLTSQGYPLTGTEIFFVIVVLNLAIAVPLSVANVGPFEAAMVFTLKFFGVPLSTALAVAGIHHLLQLLGIAGCALIALAWSQGKAPASSVVSGPSA